MMEWIPENQTSLRPMVRRLAFRVRGGDGGGYEANDSKFLAQISTPMTTILDGRDSWVSRARVGFKVPSSVRTGHLQERLLSLES